MEPNTTSPEQRDPHLWAIARKRAGFKTNLLTYLVVNAFLWAIWYFRGHHTPDNGWPWPVWPMLGWGIGLVFHYLGAYVYPDSGSAEREYEKLKNKQKP